MNPGEFLKTVGGALIPYKAAQLASTVPELSELRRAMFPTPGEIIADRQEELMRGYLQQQHGAVPEGSRQ